MYKDKNVLLIAGGGTLGTYTAKELLRLGCNVDIICPEEKKSDNERLKFYQSFAKDDFLSVKEGLIIEIGKILETIY